MAPPTALVPPEWETKFWNRRESVTSSVSLAGACMWMPPPRSPPSKPFEVRSVEETLRSWPAAVTRIATPAPLPPALRTSLPEIVVSAIERASVPALP